MSAHSITGQVFGKQRQSAKHRRVQIIQATSKLWYDHSYHQTGMREIARRCQLTLAGLYHHFPSKCMLLQAVLDSLQADCERQLFAIVYNRQLSDEARFKQFCAALQTALSTPSGLGTLLRIGLTTSHAWVVEKKNQLSSEIVLGQWFQVFFKRFHNVMETLLRPFMLQATASDYAQYRIDYLMGVFTIQTLNRDQTTDRFTSHPYIPSVGHHAQQSISVSYPTCRQADQHYHVSGILGSGTLGYARLTERELECLSWCSKGKSVEETAIILGIKYTTVKDHLNRLKRKLHCTRKTQLIRVSIDLGIIQTYEKRCIPQRNTLF